MKKINKMIRMTILEIAIIIAFVIISVPIWNSFNLSEYETVAMYYDNMNYNYLEVSDLKDYILYQTSDELAIENITPIELSLINDSNTNEEYAIWMVVSKTSTLEYNTLKINIDNTTKKLIDLEKYEDEENYYFLLFEGNLVSSKINKKIILWIDEESKVDVLDKYLVFDFQNINGQIL